MSAQRCSFIAKGAATQPCQDLSAYHGNFFQILVQEVQQILRDSPYHGSQNLIDHLYVPSYRSPTCVPYAMRPRFTGWRSRCEHDSRTVSSLKAISMSAGPDEWSETGRGTIFDAVRSCNFIMHTWSACTSSPLSRSAHDRIPCMVVYWCNVRPQGELIHALSDQYLQARHSLPPTILRQLH